MAGELYYNVVASRDGEDPFENPENSVESALAEQWEQFLNSGYTTESPTKPGYYRVRWAHPRNSNHWKSGVIQARQCKNNKKRCVWVDNWFRTREILRSGEPIPFLPS